MFLIAYLMQLLTAAANAVVFFWAFKQLKYASGYGSVAITALITAIAQALVAVIVSYAVAGLAFGSSGWMGLGIGGFAFMWPLIIGGLITYLGIFGILAAAYWQFVDSERGA
jgi:hypothetical protein